LSAYYALAFADLRVPTPIPVYAPAGCARRLTGFFDRPDPEFLRGVFAFYDLHDGHQVDAPGGDAARGGGVRWRHRVRSRR
jgi:hypothetical protein